LKQSTLFNRTNGMYMRTFVLRRLSPICIMLKIIAFFRITKFFRIYVRVDHFLSRGKHFNDPIIPSGREWGP
jgi:hypothetical protein